MHCTLGMHASASFQQHDEEPPESRGYAGCWRGRLTSFSSILASSFTVATSPFHPGKRWSSRYLMSGLKSCTVRRADEFDAVRRKISSHSCGDIF